MMLKTSGRGEVGVEANIECLRRREAVDFVEARAISGRVFEDLGDFHNFAMISDGENISQMALHRISAVEALRPIAGPQRLNRLPRLVDREGRMRAVAQLGLQVRHLMALGYAVEGDR